MNWDLILRGGAVIVGVGLVALAAVVIAAWVDRRHGRRNVAEAVEQAEALMACDLFNTDPAPTPAPIADRRRPMPNIRAARIEAEVHALTAHLDDEYAALIADNNRKGGAQ